jgi:hypothetical protein
MDHGDRRPMDLRLAFAESKTVAISEQPQELVDYFNHFRALLVCRAFTSACSLLTPLHSLASPPSGNAASALPIAPIQVTYDGESYVLMHSASVRQSRELVKPKENPADELESLSEEAVVPVPVLSESVLDQESGLRSSSCEVGCVISDYAQNAHANDSGYMQGVFGSR